MSDYLIFGTVDTRTFNVALFDVNTETAAAQEYDAQSIPGRSGDLLMRRNRYPNAEQRYQGVIYENYRANVNALKAALLSSRGYLRLEDSFNTDEFYLAAYRGVIKITKDRKGTMGKFDLVFDRKPQRYLKSGQTKTTLTTTGSITNPTGFEARPLLRVYGTGALGIGTQTITITGADGYTDIDCELMEAYKDTMSKNRLIRLSGNDYPVLHAGTNGISLGAGITRVEITPRWWRL